MKFLTDALIVRYDDELRSIVIEHPNKNEYPAPFVQVREETFSQMRFEECSEFVGARVLLLMPSMRERFKEEIEEMKDRR